MGSYPFLVLTLFVMYHATQEFYGIITSNGIAKGMEPPPPLVTAATTVLCMSMAFMAFYYKGRSSAVLAVASFALMVLQVLSIKKPRFAQLASSVFGLFYCGELGWVGQIPRHTDRHTHTHTDTHTHAHTHRHTHTLTWPHGHMASTGLHEQHHHPP